MAEAAISIRHRVQLRYHLIGGDFSRGSRRTRLKWMIDFNVGACNKDKI